MQTGFLLAADQKKFRFLNTGSTWKALPNQAYAPNRVDGEQVKGGCLKGKGELYIPAHTQARVLLDWGYETTAYPLLQGSGGQHAPLTLTYVEAPYGGEPKNKIKGTRIGVAKKGAIWEEMKDQLWQFIAPEQPQFLAP